MFLAGHLLVGTYRTWFARWGGGLGLPATLPTWPLSPTADGPAIVIGEVHHPVKLTESPTPDWLVIPERGLYTGVAIIGAVGSGKTSACMHPFARQLLSWQATNPERRVAALVLEVKGDFCHDIRQILAESGREGDYLELSMDGGMTLESALGLVARFVLARLYRLVAPQSTVRQGEGTVLAAGVHQSGPVDHRAVPRASRPVGHAPRRVPLRHR